MTNRIKAILTALLILMAVSAMAGTAAAELPETWDWRNVNETNYVTPVKDQGTCGSCWAHGALATIESNILIENPQITTIDLSEQYYISGCWGLGDCSGSFVEGVEFKVLKHCMNVGTMIETCFPYLASNSPCNHCVDWETNAWRIETYGSVSYATETLKTQIMMNGPVMASMYTDEWYQPPSSHKSHISHEVCIIGWNDSAGDGCWIVKNSYGTGWGYDGYGLIAYGDVSNIGAVYGSYQMPPCERYDTNNDCYIDYDELKEAIYDYLTAPIGSLISQEDLQILIAYYQSGDPYC